MYGVPNYVSEALYEAFTMIYWEGTDEEKYEAFASRWAGLDLATFRRVLAVGQGEDKVLAIFAIGYSGAPQAAEEIVPFLESSQRMERWASALCLGAMKDKRAFAPLETMLVEGLSPAEYLWVREHEDDPLRWSVVWCNAMRPMLVPLLEPSSSPSLITTMRSAFAGLWEVEQVLAHPFDFEYQYYDALAYALGQRGAFGALTGLSLPPRHLNPAMMYMAFGSLQGKPYSELWLKLSDEDLQQQVATVLGQRFGLSPAQQQDCVQHLYSYEEARNRYGESNWRELAKEEEDEVDDEETIEEDEVEEDEEKERFIPILLRVYRAHSSLAHSAAWSPDGTRLVSGSEDGAVHLWDADTGETQLICRGHTAPVNVVAWSPQGHFVASGSNDSTVRVWDAQTGKQISVYTGHSSFIYRGLAWSPDGTRIASGSWDRTVQVWEALSATPLLTYRGHEGIVCSVTWSPDGRRIASGGGYPESLIQVWNAATGATVLTYRGHTAEGTGTFFSDGEEEAYGASSVHSLHWSPDGQYLASAGLRYVTRLWNAATGADHLVLLNRTCGPLVWFPDGRSLLSPSFGMRKIDVWDATTGQIQKTYDPEGLFSIEALALSPDGTRIAAVGGDGTVKIWRV